MTGPSVKRRSCCKSGSKRNERHSTIACVSQRSRASFVMALWGAFALNTAASAQNVIEDVAVAKAPLDARHSLSR